MYIMVGHYGGTCVTLVSDSQTLGLVLGQRVTKYVLKCHMAMYSNDLVF